MSKDEIRTIRNDTLAEEDKNALSGAVILDPDTLDAAIIGVHENLKGEFVAVYDQEAIIDIIVKEKMSGDAQLDKNEVWRQEVEFMDYNTLPAIAHMGSRAPILASEFLEHMQYELEDMPIDERPEIVEFNGRKWAL